MSVESGPHSVIGRVSKKTYEGTVELERSEEKFVGLLMRDILYLV